MCELALGLSEQRAITMLMQNAAAPTEKAASLQLCWPLSAECKARAVRGVMLVGVQCFNVQSIDCSSCRAMVGLTGAD